MVFLKILLISFEFPAETGFGGIGTYTWYQARALAKLGHEVHVLAGASEPTPLRSVEVDGVQVHRFRSQSKLMRAFVAFGDNSLSWTKKRLENAFSMRDGMKLLCQTHRFVLDVVLHVLKQWIWGCSIKPWKLRRLCLF